MLKTVKTLCPNEIFLLVLYSKLGIVHCIYLGGTGYNLQIKIVFLSLKIVFVLAKSVDPDEIHCLPK